MKFNKKTLAKVLGEDRRGFGPYTYVKLIGDEVLIGIEIGGIAKSKSIRANDLLMQYKEWMFDNGVQARTWKTVPGWTVEIAVSKTKELQRTGWFEPFGETLSDGAPMNALEARCLPGEGRRQSHKNYYKNELEAVERAAWWFCKNQNKIEETLEKEKA